MSKQTQLDYLIKLAFKELQIPQIQKIISCWDNDTAFIKIQISNKLTPQQQEDVETSLAEIMAQFETGQLEVEYLMNGKRI